MYLDFRLFFSRVIKGLDYQMLCVCATICRWCCQVYWFNTSSWAEHKGCGLFVCCNLLVVFLGVWVQHKILHGAQRLWATLCALVVFSGVSVQHQFLCSAWKLWWLPEEQGPPELRLVRRHLYHKRRVSTSQNLDWSKLGALLPTNHLLCELRHISCN